MANNKIDQVTITQCGVCQGKILRQTSFFCPACDGMENPRRELIAARKRIAELEAELLQLRRERDQPDKAESF